VVTLTVAFVICILVTLPLLKISILVGSGLVNSPAECLIATYAGGVSFFEFAVPLAVFAGVFARKSVRARLNIRPWTLWSLRGLCVVILAAAYLNSLGEFLGPRGLVILLSSAVVLCAAAIGHALVTSFGIAPVLSTAAATSLVTGIPLMFVLVQDLGRNTVWNDWCPRAKDQFHSLPGQVTRVQFKGMGILQIFAQLDGQRYAALTRENVGKSLLERGYLLEYEDNNSNARLKDPLVLARAGSGRLEPLAKSTASHVVDLSFLSELREQSKHHFYGFRVSVRDVSKNMTIAERTVIQDMSRKRVCGQVYDDKIDTSDFVVRALGLKLERR
jgi:hypothetical protein